MQLVPRYKTYARRLSDDRISERAWIDVSRKIELEGAERTEVCFILDSAKMWGLTTWFWLDMLFMCSLQFAMLVGKLS